MPERELTDFFREIAEAKTPEELKTKFRALLESDAFHRRLSRLVFEEAEASQIDEYEILRMRFALACFAVDNSEFENLFHLIKSSKLAGAFGFSVHPLGDDSLPAKAPVLWKERDKSMRLNAAEFIRFHYAPWLGKGLKRAHIGILDQALYEAYAQRIKNHPEDVIAELITEPRKKRDDPKEALDRIREQGRASAARYRADRSPD